MRAAAILLLLGAPADAHCYSVWHYPYPQHCHAGGGVYARAADAHVWYVEITRLPDDIERDDGIAKLKELMK